MRNFLFLLTIVCLSFSCNKYDAEEQLEEDIQAIEDYIAEKGLTGFTQTDSGLFYVIDEEGTGTDQPTLSSTVICDYVGFLLDDNGTVFDAGTGVEFGLTGVIKGWQEGIPLLKRNGTARFFIPSTLAYGNQRQGQSIGRNEILGFSVTLNHFWD